VGEVEPGRGFNLSTDPFPRPASRTGRATWALAICDRASVLVNGRVEMSGAAHELTDRQAMLASFLGQKDAAEAG
jgi:hypothetical protein